MECRTIQSLLPFLDLPEEQGAEERADLERHLAQCPKCAATAQAERMFDERIGQAIQNVAVPAGLRDQLLGRMTVERGNAWRKQALRVGAAVAAGLLIAVLSIGWWANRKVEISADLLASGADEWSVKSSDPAALEEYFRGQGLTVKLPPDFDPNLLGDYEVVEFDGRTAARLDFQHNDSRAKVYVLPKRDFRVKKGSEKLAVGSRCSVEVVEMQDLIFVIVYVGDANRQQFLNRNQQVG